MYKYIKRLLDFIMALIFLIILFPLMVIIFLILKINLKGKTIFKQERMGLYKKPFIIYKFKSMKDDITLNRDQRITKVSKVIRQSGLDELPQLFNIIKGDMSFIGPRPFMTKDKLPKNSYNPKRYLVKPGVFGYAQSEGRRYSTHDNKIKNDLKYVDEISFKIDIKLFFKSILIVIIQFFDLFTNKNLKN
ncbi:MAG: sugar transferase [Bacilli bacterium]|nr:sugar transferase [Bacilli bacterium]MDD4406828.1 sugar transferase [Bacilli bacterium]